MDARHENCFVLYVRSQPGRDKQPEAVEKPLLICSSYQEARYLQRAVRGMSHDCVIRYVGATGGGD
jgi:hypothetical protein